MFNRIMSKRGGLWHHADFMNVWISETISMFGSQISMFAIPLIAALTLDASPLEMGILSAAGPFPRLLIGFFAGAWADRLPRLPIMIVSSIGRVLVLLAIPLTAMTDHLTFTVLLTVNVLSGLLGVFFDAAWSAMLPGLVPRRHLTDATSKLMGSSSLAQVAGPALGGLIVGLVGGPAAIWIPVTTFSLAAWFLHRVDMKEGRNPRSTNAPNMWHEVWEGIHEMWSNATLRTLTNSSVIINFGGGIFLSVYVLFMTRDLGLDSQGVGLILATGGVGALIGTMVAPRIADRFGVGHSIFWSALIFGLGNTIVPLAFYFQDIALAAVMVSEALAWMSLVVFNINRFTLRQALTADYMRGRVGASNLTLVAGATLLGSLIGGVVGDIWSVHAALYVGIVIMALAAIAVWRSPVPGYMTLPEEEDVAGEVAVV